MKKKIDFLVLWENIERIEHQTKYLLVEHELRVSMTLVPCSQSSAQVLPLLLSHVTTWFRSELAPCDTAEEAA